MAEQKKQETVLITGASSGIGEALAWEFAAHGHNLILVARGVDALNSLAAKLSAEHDVKLRIESADLSQAGSAAGLAQSLHSENIEVDILINCAGVLEHGAFTDIKAKDHQRIVQLNVAGLTDMLAYFLPAMVARKSGRIMNVSSITAFQPVPSLATYAATKAYVLSLSEALSEELRGVGVTVTALCPGFTATNMLAGAGTVANDVPSIMVGDVKKVARTGFEACMNGRPLVVPGTINLLNTVISRALPKWLIRRIAGRVGHSTL